MTDHPNPREFTRSVAAKQVELRNEDGDLLASGETRDVSMNGLFIHCKEQIEVGTLCIATIFLDPGSKSLRIDGPAQIVRCDGEGIAVHFDGLPLESYHHLRNLVLFNASDTEPVLDELNSHVGLKKKG